MADEEVALLSRMVASGSVEVLLSLGIESRHFSDQLCQSVYQTCVDHVRAWRLPPSQRVVAKNHPEFKLRAVPDALEYLADEFLKAVTYREAIKKWQEIGDALEDPQRKGRMVEVFSEVAREMARIVPTSRATRYSQVIGLVDQMQREQKDGSHKGIPTGVAVIDALTDGVRDWEMCVICAYLGVGKTTLLLRMAFNAYMAGRTPLIISLEVEEAVIRQKFLTMATQMHYSAMRKRDIGEEGWQMMREEANRAAQAANDVVILDDLKGHCTVDRVAGAIHAYGPNAVFIDYVSQMTDSEGAQSGWERVTNITRGLKQLARAEKVPLFVAAQSNRDALEDGPTLDNIAYCVPLDTEILTRDGWKGHDCVEVGDQTVGLRPDGVAYWTNILEIVRYEDAPLVKIGHSRWSAITTPNHRWLSELSKRTMADGVRRAREWSAEFVQTDSIGDRHRLRLSGPLCSDVSWPATADEAAIMGWVMTDGGLFLGERSGYHDRFNKSAKVEASIYQKKPNYVEEIRSLLPDGSYVEYRPTDIGKIQFRLRSVFARDLVDRLGVRQGWTRSVLGMSDEQRVAFLDACWKAEGWMNGRSKILSQNGGEKLEAIVLAVQLSGHRPGVSSNGYSPAGNHNFNVNFCKPTVLGESLVVDDYGRGDVWCVRTELGTWTMRQGRMVCVTGNSISPGQDADIVVGIHQNPAMRIKKQVRSALLKNRDGDIGGQLEYWDRDRLDFHSWTKADEWATRPEFSDAQAV